MADSVIGKLIYKITGDSSQLDKNLKKSDKEVKGFGKTLGTLGKLLKGTAVAGAISFAAKKILDLGKAVINSASDAEETGNKFSVVFQNIRDEAEASATSLSDNFGLSSTAAKTLLSDTGDLLTGFGFTQESALDLSTQVNELAVDLASFTNFSGGAEGASQALTKALLGERESVKALGISILDADVKAKVLEQAQQGLTFETERQAKANATLAIALEQSQNAIGDFARSSDSFANKQREARSATEDLRVELGKQLLPAATEAITIFGELTSKIAGYIEEHNKLQEVVGRFEDDKDTAEDALFIAERELKTTRDLLNEKKEILANLEVMTRLDASRKQDLESEVKALTDQTREQSILIDNIHAQVEAEKEIADAKERGDLATAEALKKEEERLQAIRDLITARKSITATYESELEVIDRTLKAGVISTEESVNRRIDAEKEFQKALIDLNYDGLADSQGVLDIGDQQIIDSVNRRIALETEAVEEVKAVRELDLENFGLTLDGRLQNQADFHDLSAEQEQEAADERQRIAREAMNGVVSVSQTGLGMLNEIFQLQVENARAALVEFEAINGSEIEALEAKALTEEGLTAKESARLNLLNDEKKALMQEQYERELKAFKTSKALRIADTIITGAQAAISAYASLAIIPFVGPFLGAAAATAVGTLTLAQVGLISAQQPPSAPAFANGGIVQGSSFTGDNVKANVNSGEMVLTEQMQSNLLSLANGGGNSGNTRVIVNLDSRVILNAVAKASRNGTMIIDARSVK